MLQVCFMCSRAYMLSVPACLGARVFSMLACFMPLRAHISYKLAVLKYLTGLRAWYATSLTKREGSSRKKVMKNETGVGCDAKQFLQPIFFDDTIFAPSYFSNRF